MADAAPASPRKTIAKAPKKEKRPPPAWFLAPPCKPRDWVSERPRGLYTRENAISDETHAQLLTYFADVDWKQRFGKQYPQTAHYNYMHTQTDATEPEALQAELAQRYPELYRAAHEAFASMQDVVPPGTHAAFDTFAPESIAVHKHAPNWGLGAHYDNAQDVGVGLVLMLNVGTEPDDASPTVPREFRFTDPPGGRTYSVLTPPKLGLVFTGHAYDFWKHESIRNKKQTGTCYSITIRLKRVCGYGKTVADGLPYKPGAGPAEQVAHTRIAALRARGERY